MRLGGSEASAELAPPFILALIVMVSTHASRSFAAITADLGVQRAADELVIRGKPGRGQAIVLLSDGMVNPVPAAEAVSAAARARQQGATIWVVGLGPKLDETTLRAMASGTSRYQRADSVQAVEAIYRDLTRKVPCPSHQYWAGR